MKVFSSRLAVAQFFILNLGLISCAGPVDTASVSSVKSSLKEKEAASDSKNEIEVTEKSENSKVKGEQIPQAKEAAFENSSAPLETSASDSMAKDCKVRITDAYIANMFQSSSCPAYSNPNAVARTQELGIMISNCTYSEEKQRLLKLFSSQCSKYIAPNSPDDLLIDEVLKNSVTSVAST